MYNVEIVINIKQKDLRDVKEETDMYRVEMFIDGDWYVYGTYRGNNKANQIAKEIEEQRQCRTYISKVNYTMINGVNC